jgi:hypothetical protein
MKTQIVLSNTLVDTIVITKKTRKKDLISLVSKSCAKRKGFERKENQANETIILNPNKPGKRYCSQVFVIKFSTKPKTGYQTLVFGTRKKE